MKNIIELRNVSKEYQVKSDSIVALKNISLDIRQGEMLAIMGRSGSGKSTLLNILGVMHSFDDGEIKIDGWNSRNLFKEPEASKYRREYVGFIFQNFNLINDITVKNNLEIPLLINGIDTQEVNDRIIDISEKVGILDKLEMVPLDLSGGQQQRVAIARALIKKPRMILADEPTGALDINTALEIMNIIKEANKTFEQTIVIVTHDATIASFADRVVFLHDGEIVYEHNNSNDRDKNIKDIMNVFSSILV